MKLSHTTKKSHFLPLKPLVIAIRYASLTATLAAFAATSLTVSAADRLTTAEKVTEKTQSYSIPASTLSIALNRFAQKAKVSIVMDETQLKKLNSEGLQGRYNTIPDKALQNY